VLARELRRAGASVDVAPEGRLKRSLELANKLGARYALIVGGDEMAAGAYSLKEMGGGEQRAIRRAEIAGAILQSENNQTGRN
jgi:histidyl-tRNA synthetase